VGTAASGCPASEALQLFFLTADCEQSVGISVDKICQAFSSSVRFLERIQALELLSFPPGVAGVRLMSGDLETGRHRRWQANCQ